jgi:chromatin remodeling complex protein RSC6
MVRTSKASAPAPTPVAEKAPVVAAAPSEKPVKVSKKKDAAAAAPAPVAEKAAAPVPVVSVADDSVAVEAEASMAEQSGEFVAKLQQLGALIASLKTEYRALEKKWTRTLKTAEKQNSKRKRKTGNRSPSGFVKPTLISDELATFLEKPSGSEMARTDVTREINKYIRAHGLQDKENGRKINPDQKLSSLLRLKKTDELTYFNLQKHMSPHFAKSVKAVAAAADAAATA